MYIIGSNKLANKKIGFGFSWKKKTKINPFWTHDVSAKINRIPQTNCQMINLARTIKRFHANATRSTVFRCQPKRFVCVKNRVNEERP